MECKIGRVVLCKVSLFVKRSLRRLHDILLSSIDIGPRPSAQLFPVVATLPPSTCLPYYQLLLPLPLPNIAALIFLLYVPIVNTGGAGGGGGGGGGVLRGVCVGTGGTD